MSSKCNTKKSFKRREPTEAFTWAQVNRQDNALQNFVIQRVKIVTFWEEKSQYIVRVFVGSPLPWLVRLGKVYRSLQCLFEHFELGEFRAVVKRKAANGFVFQKGRNGFSCLRGRTALNNTDTQEPRFSVDKRNQQPFTNASVYGVALPVSNSFSALDRGWPLGDDPIRMDRVVVGIFLALPLSSASEVLLGSDMRQSLGADSAVYCRHRKFFPFRIEESPSAADLFRRPVTVQLFYDIVPLRRFRNESKLLQATPAAYIQIFGSPVVVQIRIVRFAVRFVFRFVPVDFPADGGWTSFEKICDLSETESFRQKLL